jgi:hypothetical protein
LSRRALLALIGLSGTLLFLEACAAARRFAPAGPEDVRAALSAWETAGERASSLPPSRLLYDAHMGTSGLPSVPGTLAVTYGGRDIRSAALTGPFGSRVAEYAEGVVTGEDRKACVVDPDVLRSVLAGVWSGAPDAVVGRDGNDCLLSWDGGGKPYRAEGVLDLSEQRLRSLSVSGRDGRLSVSYSGALRPWPERIAVKDGSGRSLSLALIATEPLAADPSGGP